MPPPPHQVTASRKVYVDNGRGLVVSTPMIEESIQAERKLYWKAWVDQADEDIPTYLTIDISKLKLFAAWYTPDNPGDVTGPTLFTNVVNPGTDSIVVAPNKPVVWTPSSGLPQLFTVDVTQIYYDSGGAGREGVLNIYVLEDKSEV